MTMRLPLLTDDHGIKRRFEANRDLVESRTAAFDHPIGIYAPVEVHDDSIQLTAMISENIELCIEGSLLLLQY